MGKFIKTKYFDDKGHLLYDKFSDFMIEEYNIVTINGQINSYKEGVYVPGDKVIEQAMLKLVPSMRQNQRKEILSMIFLKAEEYNDTGKHANLIAFRNGVYNLATREFLPFSKDYIITNKINWVYDPTAECKDIDTLLDKISCYDPEIRDIMEEVIGYAMYRSLEKQVAFILVGGGSNGKSTYTRVLQKLLGKDNYSTVDLSEFSSNRFASAELYGKLANIGDDISGEYISDPSTFKSLASGESITTSKKFGQPFSFESYATMIYSANRIPRVKDADGGVKRRMKIVPFNQKFDPKAPDFDGGIATRIMYGTDECSADTAMSYLINLAIAGLHRVLNYGFTVSAKCEEAVENYDRECNPTLEWAEEFLEQAHTFHMMRRDEVYNAYVIWADNCKQKTLSKNAFVRFINERFNMKVEPKYQAGYGTVRTFVSQDYSYRDIPF